jgi:cytosine/uracil/thiamine/allantoin permease
VCRNLTWLWDVGSSTRAVWELAGSMLAIGLSWYELLHSIWHAIADPMFCGRRQALPAIAVGHIIIAIVMVLNGTFPSQPIIFSEANNILYFAQEQLVPACMFHSPC